MKLTQENLLSVLKTNRTRDELTQLFNVCDREVRKHIAKLTEKGYAIKSHSKEAGYRLLDPKLSADRLQISKTVADLNSKAKSIKKRADAINSRYQLKIEFDYPKLSDNLEPVIGQKYLTDEGVVVECVKWDDCSSCIFLKEGEDGAECSNEGANSCISSARKDQTEVMFIKSK